MTLSYSTTCTVLCTVCPRIVAEMMAHPSWRPEILNDALPPTVSTLDGTDATLELLLDNETSAVPLVLIVTLAGE